MREKRKVKRKSLKNTVEEGDKKLIEAKEKIKKDQG